MLDTNISYISENTNMYKDVLPMLLVLILVFALHRLRFDVKNLETEHN